MEAIILLGSAALAERVRNARHQGTPPPLEAGDSAPWDSTRYFRDDHQVGLLAYRESYYPWLARGIGATTLDSDMYSRWVQADQGVYAPRMWAWLQQQYSMTADIENGWEKWQSQVLNSAKNPRRRP